MMVIALDFFLCGVKKEPGCSGINPAIGISNFLGCLTGTVVGHDANNNVLGAPANQGTGKKYWSESEAGELRAVPIVQS